MISYTVVGAKVQIQDRLPAFLFGYTAIGAIA
jgi:hypothetical protein